MYPYYKPFIIDNNVAILYTRARNKVITALNKQDFENPIERSLT